MQLRKSIGRVLFASAMALAAVPTMAQDLLARQAPIDRRATKVDTMALHLLEKSETSEAVAQLYDEWSNKYAHKATTLPDSFRIDLRHFHMPTPSRVITSNFGRRWGRMHKGLDIKVYIGDTIRSAFDGKVRIVRYEANGYGNYVVIRHNNGLETIYGHMSKHLVAENQVVKAGTPIGLGGNTGRSTGSHLHFETRLCGVALNPALMFDFKNQDVTSDYYTFRRSSYERESEKASRTYGKPATPATSQPSVAAAPATSRQRNVAAATAKTNTRQQAKTAKGKKQQANDMRYHKVAKGETLYSIARKSGVTVDQLCKKNGIKADKAIRPGQIIRY